jgi:DsbC/DsbD-like thiol-disulfide interchange protein
MFRRAPIFIFAALTVAMELILGVSGQVIKQSPLPLPSSDAVQFVSPPQVTVAANTKAQIDLHFRIAEGLHINSHDPGDKFLVPTRLAVVEAPGLNVTAVDFPPGVSYSFPFSQGQKLSVYTGEFVLHAHLTAQKGEHDLAAALHYQACDNNSCLPAHTVPVSLTIVAQ